MRKTLQGTGDTYGGHLIPTPATLGAAPESRLMADPGDVVDEIVVVVEMANLTPDSFPSAGKRCTLSSA